MYRKYWVLLCLFLAVNCVYAQDSISLPAVQIIESKPIAHALNDVYKKDDFSATKQLNPANISQVFRQQGPGRLLTLRRGALGPEHTKVKWGCLSLGSPLSGVADFSLYPVFLFSNIKSISEGKQVLSLENIQRENQLLLGFGSQSFYQVGLKYRFQKDKFFAGIKTYIEGAQNDYKITNTLGKERRLEQAEHRMQHAIVDAGYLFNENLNLKGQVWLAKNDAELPSSLSLQPEDQHQGTESIRGQLTLKYNRKHVDYTIGGGMISEALEYRNNTSGLKGNHDFRTFVGEASMQTKTTLWPIKITANTQKVVGVSSNFENKKSRDSYSLTSEIKGKLAGLDVFGLGKVNYVDEQTFFNGKIAVEKQILKELKGQINFSRIYRIPTFNELCWTPGGNLNLKPEEGYSLGLILLFKKKQTHISTELEWIDLKNGIRWSPLEGLWQPQNIDELQSIQSTTAVNQSIQFDQINVNFGGQFTYTYVAKASGGFKGNQLIFIPKTKYSIPLSVYHKMNKWGLKFTPFYRGKMFTLEGEKRPLDASWILDLNLFKKLNIFDREATFMIQLENLTNTSYAWSNGYPMPGRRLFFQIKYNLNK